MLWHASSWYPALDPTQCRPARKAADGGTVLAEVIGEVLSEPDAANVANSVEAGGVILCVGAADEEAEVRAGRFLIENGTTNPLRAG